jgi:hypothetical protein
MAWVVVSSGGAAGMRVSRCPPPAARWLARQLRAWVFPPRAPMRRPDAVPSRSDRQQALSELFAKAAYGRVRLPVPALRCTSRPSTQRWGKGGGKVRCFVHPENCCRLPGQAARGEEKACGVAGRIGVRRPSKSCVSRLPARSGNPSNHLTKGGGRVGGGDSQGHPVSPFRSLLSFVNHLPDLRPQRRSHCRRPSETQRSKKRGWPESVSKVYPFLAPGEKAAAALKPDI